MSQYEPSKVRERALGPFQFTVARLLACTTAVAAAAWVSTLDIPIEIHTSASGDRNLAPAILVSVLLAVAVGVLIRGKPGAKEGAKAGCIFCIVVIAFVLPLFAGLREVFNWLSRF